MLRQLTHHLIRAGLGLAALAGVTLDMPPALAATGSTGELAEVLVYPTVADGSIMYWLCISPLTWNVAYVGDSMNYDVFKKDAQSELTIQPRAGDVVQGQAWHKMHFNGTNEGATMCSLFDVAGHGFDYGITACAVYAYSPIDRPNATMAGSADDALKVILNGRKIWSNQIQRSPTYDSDTAPAPLKKGWNLVICVVDQIIGGHLLCFRLLDGDKALTDLEIALDPPTAEAMRHAAAPYNQKAADLMRRADTQKAAGQFAPAVATCDEVLAQYGLAETAPRAAYTRALAFFSTDGGKSMDQPKEALTALQALLARYGQDLLAEYALLDLAKIQEVGLKDAAAAATTYGSFETRFPRSPLAATAQVELARLLAAQGKFEDAILSCRKIIKKYPNSDEVMTATLRIADAYAVAGDKAKARAQYLAARTMAQDWHDNRYGVDVGKQAWLETLLDAIRKALE